MTLYNVHIYREMKLRFDAIEAESPEAAADIARDRLTEDADDIEPCDGETFSALVDVVGDEHFSQSQMIDFQRQEDASMKPIVGVTVRGGLVTDVNATSPVTVFVEDWDCPPDKPLVMDFEADNLTAKQEKRVRERLAENDEPCGNGGT